MAARHLGALRNHPGLNRFCIPSVKITFKDKQLGAGSYGRVVELDIDGTICAGKIMHEVLIQGNEVVQKYVKECQLMSDIRHPNIVQFLGLCFLPNSLPVLVFERLLTSFDDLLEENHIPLCLKRSILADVAKGLIYLHNRNPPVIHRDLTARNVLLNSSMQAKISDLGNARIIDFRLAQKSLSSMPGTPTYMPPEAFGDKCQCYGHQLDSFSFGQLTLFAVTQVFPYEILPATYPDPGNPGCVISRTEIERRIDYIKLLHQQLERHHPLVQLVNQCLHNDPLQRPSAKELLQRLQDMEAQIENPYGHLTTLEMMRKVKDKDVEAQQLQCNLDTKRSMWQQEKEKLLSQLEQLQMRNKQICLHKDQFEMELKTTNQKCSELFRYRKVRDQARKQAENLRTKVQEHESRRRRYREEHDQARKQTEELRAQLQQHETKINRYREERDQARKQTEDLQAKLLECETRKCAEHDQAQKETEELQAKLQQHETRIYRYRGERDQARKQKEELQAKLQEYETKLCHYREEHGQVRKQTENLHAKLQEYKNSVCIDHYREECDQARKQTKEVEAKLQKYKARIRLYHKEHAEARASVNTLQSQAQAAATINSSDPDRFNSTVRSAHSGKCGLLHAHDHEQPGGQSSGTNEFKTIVRTRRGLVQMLMKTPTTPLNHKNKPRVIVKQSDEHYYETGRLMYTGQLSGKEIAGIQLDCHRAQTPGYQNDGSNYLGKQYFVCPAGYALYLPLSMVYVEAVSMKCPLCQVPVTSVNDLQLQYLTNCTTHAGGRSNIPTVLPQPMVSTQQTVQPGGPFGSTQQQSLQPTQVKLHATGVGPSISAPSQGVSEQTLSAFRNISLSFSPNSGREEGRMGGAHRLGAPKWKNSGSQLQSMFSGGNNSLGSGRGGTKGASGSTVFGTNFNFSAGVSGESGNTSLLKAGSNLDSGNTSGRLIVKSRRRKP